MVSLKTFYLQNKNHNWLKTYIYIYIYIYYGLFFYWASFRGPLSILFLLRITLIYLIPSLFNWNFSSLVILSSELIRRDTATFVLSLITWVLTFGCLLTVLLSHQEDSLLYLVLIFIASCSISVFNSFIYLEFYINFELTLFPILIIILGWGYQTERFAAGIALILYTIVASLPFFIFLTFTNYRGNQIFWQTRRQLIAPLLDLTFYLVVVAFLVKLPIFLVHIWLPKAHVEAPVYGSIFLAGSLLKLGGLGLIRFSAFLNCSLSIKFVMLSFISLVAVGLVCLFRRDIKVLIAYSSVAHISFALITVFSLRKTGAYIRLIVILTHGFSSSLIFFLAHLFYLRSSTRSIIVNQNSLNWSSGLSLVWFVGCVGLMGGPPASTLITESLRIICSLAWWPGALIWTILGAFLGGGYRIILFARAYHNYSLKSEALKVPLSTLEIIICIFHLFWLLRFFGIFSWIIFYN